MAPLMTEAIAKADALLKICENDSISTATPSLIMGWLHNTNMGPPPSIAEVPHPLAPSPSPGTVVDLAKLGETSTLEEIPVSTTDVKEEVSTSMPYFHSFYS